MNYLRFRDLFHEFAGKLEEQHMYYLDSIIGFSILHERVMAKQLNFKKILGDHELANEEFLDTCSTIYRQLSNRDYIPMSLYPVMKQGEVKARNRDDGGNYLILGANCVVALYSYWEEYLRIEVGIAKGVLEAGATNNEETQKILNQHVVSDIWGDLRHLRNSIVHKNGVATADVAKCKIIRCFLPGDKIELDFDKMRDIFMLLADYRNELDRLSRPPWSGIKLPGRV